MELLERYRPLFLIGRGGMGTVEVAVESGEHHGGRVVALKRMLPEVREQRHVDMFLREARLATLLNHENVVHAFAFGEQHHELFIAMEYVEGETLASLQDALAARHERIPIAVAAYVLAALCEGLHAAHELRDVSGKPLGVVHRDVSPHNVMLSYTGDVKLLDFGVAKLEGAAHLTKTGEVKGKTAYMSPEQAMSDPLDRRADLYGVGVLLFELLAGRRMWRGQSDLELLRELALGEAPRLAEAAPEVPRELAELHACLVAKRAKDRAATALEIRATLERFLTADARATLVRMLDQHFGEQKRRKRHRLDVALAKVDTRTQWAQVTNSLPPPLPMTRPWATLSFVAVAAAAVASVGLAGIYRQPVRTAPATATQVAPTGVRGVNLPASVSSAAPVSPTAPPATPVSPAVPPATPVSPAVPTLRPVPRRREPPAATASTTEPPRPPLDVDPHAI